MSRRAFVAAAAMALAAAAPLAAWGAESSAVYDKNCAICHQAGGVGAPGAFPRLAGRAGALAALPTGRRMMISAVLRGMYGPLQVDGQSLFGVMPALGGVLDDAQISEVLNYVTGLGGAKRPPFTPAEVAAVRAQPALTAAQNNALARDPDLARAAP